MTVLQAFRITFGSWTPKRVVAKHGPDRAIEACLVVIFAAVVVLALCSVAQLFLRFM